jgi:hypothetical protein
VNLTPHEINIYAADTPDVISESHIPMLTVPTSGSVARVNMSDEVIGKVGDIPLHRTSVVVQVVNLPEPQEGVVYIASRLVVDAAKRSDVVSVHKTVRSNTGQIIGCKAFAV